MYREAAMGTITEWPKEGIQSDDVDMLQTVLKDWCQETDIDIKSSEAQFVARSLVDWYEFGIKDPAELRSLLAR
jgi:hypothetical protein